MDIDDLNKKYADCFIKVNGKLTFVVKFIPILGGYIARAFIDGKSESFDFEDNIELIAFNPGLYNFKNSVVLVRKTCKRQWKRGFCSECFDILDVTIPIFKLWSSKLAQIRQRAQHFCWSWRDVTSLLPPCTTYQEAKRKLTHPNVIARAFEKDWYLTRAMDTKGLWLFFRTVKVATIQEDCIIITNKVFTEEVIDLNRRQQIGEIEC